MSDSRLKVYQDSDQPAVVRPTALANPGRDLFTDARMALVRNSLAKDAPEDVFVAMVEIARTRGLDPLAKQIGVIRFGDQWQVMTTIDGYRALAEKTGHYAGSDEPVFTYSGQTVGPDKKKILRPDSASVTVWKLLNGQRFPFTATVYWEEYAAFNVWLSKPRTMLAKVAESHALRKAFPSVLSGMYVDGEMDQLAIETTGSVSPTPRPAAPATQDDLQRALASLHATAADLGMNHDDIRQFVADRASKPVAQVASMTTWSVQFIGRTRELIEEHGGDWVRSQGDAVIEAEVVETGLEGTLRRPLRAGEFVDEHGQIVPAEDGDDVTVFPTTPASLLPSEDPQQATTRRDWTN